MPRLSTIAFTASRLRLRITTRPRTIRTIKKDVRVGRRQPPSRSTKRVCLLPVSEERPRAQCPHEVLPRRFSRLAPLVLGKETQVASHLLAIHCRPVPPRRRPSDVHE